MDIGADACHDLGPQQVVHELLGILRMVSISRYGHHVIENERAFLGDDIVDMDAVVGLLRPFRALEDISAPADGHADVSVCEVIDEL